MLTKEGAGVSEGPDLGIRQANKQRKQSREEVVVVNETILAGVHQKLGKLTQARFKALELGTWSGQWIAHRILERRWK